MNAISILHNPNCSKSREALALLQTHGIKPQIIDYLSGGLNQQLLRTIIQCLKVEPREIIRTKEEAFLALNINLNDSEEVIEAILSHPQILERPIVFNGKEAVIGRPPKNVLTIILHSDEVKPT
ncbi:MAG TPA: arsenate reductase (glutaredoxin) [Bacteriovoracaceae bacterium]|nr:arsenate reductase (glutaredoxin) [Bacteriovoracaceae bacterium]